MARVASSLEEPKRLALVLMGGGARAAYQAGALRALAEIAREVRVDANRRAMPFSIICGTSAGAINAAALAAYADDFVVATSRLDDVWGSFRASDVYRTDWPGVLASGVRWLGAMSFGWAVRRSPRALFDNSPLTTLLTERIDFARLATMLDGGPVHALAVTALSYSSGQHVTFYQSDRPVPVWRRAQRSARRTQLQVDHLLASSAIPFIFRAVPLEIDGATEYFGDGSIRQIAPLSPPIHFGASRILVIGAAPSQPEVSLSAGRAVGYPTLAQIGQQVMASVFLDALGADIERIDHVNRMVTHLPHTVAAESGWRRIDVMSVAPSERVEGRNLQGARASVAK